MNPNRKLTWLETETRPAFEIAPAAIYKIQRGIPIPPRNQDLHQWSEQFNSMAAGDSFVVDSEYARLRGLRIAKSLGIRITTRKLDNGAGWRIWRVE